MGTILPVYSSQAPIPAGTFARYPIVIGDDVDPCDVVRLDLFPGDGMPAEPNDYMICELVEEDGRGNPAVTLATFDTATGDWERGKIAFTWAPSPAYQLAPGHSIVARWDIGAGNGCPVPGCAWRVTQ